MQLGTWDCDMTACVDADNGTLVRAFVFTNASQAPQALALYDVTAPLLGGDADLGAAFGMPGPGRTVTLTVYETSAPDLFVTQEGIAKERA